LSLTERAESREVLARTLSIAGGYQVGREMGGVREPPVTGELSPSRAASEPRRDVHTSLSRR